MNQAKWLSDFVYDVESTPLLWSFDGAEQDTVRARSQSFPLLKEYPESEMTVRSEDATAAVQHEYRKNLEVDKSYEEILPPSDSKRGGIRNSASYLELSHSDFSVNDERENSIENIKQLSLDRHSNHDIAGMSPDSQVSPKYIDIQSAECEASSLLRQVKAYNSYLSISSQEVDYDHCDESLTSSINPANCDTINADAKLVAPAEDKKFEELESPNDKTTAIRRADSSSSSENITPYNVEYISGGVTYTRITFCILQCDII